MPTFFETFPVVLLDKDGVVMQTYRSVVLNQKYSIEQVMFQSHSMVVN
jgi:hypothetical protein